MRFINGKKYNGVEKLEWYKGYFGRNDNNNIVLCIKIKLVWISNRLNDILDVMYAK
jgi:hypothetical protein